MTAHRAALLAALALLGGCSGGASSAPIPNVPSVPAPLVPTSPGVKAAGVNLATSLWVIDGASHLKRYAASASGVTSPQATYELPPAYSAGTGGIAVFAGNHGVTNLYYMSAAASKADVLVWCSISPLSHACVLQNTIVSTYLENATDVVVAQGNAIAILSPASTPTRVLIYNAGVWGIKEPSRIITFPQTLPVTKMAVDQFSGFLWVADGLKVGLYNSNWNGTEAPIVSDPMLGFTPGGIAVNNNEQLWAASSSEGRLKLYGENDQLAASWGGDFYQQNPIAVTTGVATDASFAYFVGQVSVGVGVTGGIAVYSDSAVSGDPPVRVIQDANLTTPGGIAIE